MTRCSGNRDALEIVHSTSALIQSRFTADDDLFNAALTADFTNVTGTPIQNPLMHLTEAWLAAREATPTTLSTPRCGASPAPSARHFVHAPSGCIVIAGRAPDNRLEPTISSNGSGWSLQHANCSTAPGLRKRCRARSPSRNVMAWIRKPAACMRR